MFILYLQNLNLNISLLKYISALSKLNMEMYRSYFYFVDI